MTALVIVSVGALLPALLACCGVYLYHRSARKNSPAEPPPLLHRRHDRPYRPTLVQGRFPGPAAAPELPWKEVSGLTKVEAEELLDWLEVNGYQAHGVENAVASGFVVRFK